MKAIASLSPLSVADAMSAGQTLRALAQQQRPNPPTAAVLGRVGDWLVNAAQCGEVATPDAQRGAELVQHAMRVSAGCPRDAVAALVGAIGAIAMEQRNPKLAIYNVIETLNEACAEFWPEVPS